MDPEKFVQELIQAAVDSVRPDFFMPETLRLSGSTLRICGQSHPGYDEHFETDLDGYEHVYLAAVGKAAFGMAAAAERTLGRYISEGIILTKQLPSESLPARYRIFQGGHPVPNAQSAAGAEAILGMLDKAGEKDLVLFLISGGGSALMAAPVDGISLDTYQSFCTAVLGCGADIAAFNTLRKHLDQVKGGRLALRAAPARQVTVILSDVVGSPKDVIASGPTVPDPSTFRDALEILDRYSAQAVFPPEIRAALQKGSRGELSETAKPDQPVFQNSFVFLAADNRTAAEAAARKARALGLPAFVDDANYTGIASEEGLRFAERFRNGETPGVMIFGGETTVLLKGSGYGGRNLEMALAAVRPMAEFSGCALVTLATDGEDGPTDAAGAFVTSQTLAKALAAGCVPEDFLERNDSWHFFEKTGGLIKTGSTGTNVNDLAFLIRFGPDPSEPV